MKLYKLLRNKVNRSRKALQRSFYDRKIRNLGGGTRGWWMDIKGLVGLQKATSNLQGLANSLCDRDTQQLAQRICEFFHSVTAEFTPLAEEDRFTPPGCDLSVSDRYIISVTDVERELRKVRTDKAVGPDRIPNWVLHDCAGFLSQPVSRCSTAVCARGTCLSCGSLQIPFHCPKLLHQHRSRKT